MVSHSPIVSRKREPSARARSPTPTPLACSPRRSTPIRGHLGNFPQAFSHVGVIDAAVYLAAVDGVEFPVREPIGIELKREREKRGARD